MKKFLLITASLLALASCSKTRVQVSSDADEEDNSPVAVRLGFNLSSGAVRTKASVGEWSGQEGIFVYSFPTNVISNSEVFINNVEAASPASGTEGQIEVKRSVATGEEPFYYDVGKQTYDFYGYYVGDARDVSPVIDDALQRITTPVTIDGSQDVMLAVADKEADCTLGPTEDNPSRKVINPANAYSAYAARKGVHPNLVFEHQLSRFVFNVKAGDEDGTRVRIDAINMTCTTKGVLTVASLIGERGLVPDADSKDVISLKPDEQLQAFVPEYDDGSHASDPDYTPYKQVGESLMVLPDTQYELELKMHFTDAQDPAIQSGNTFYYRYTLTPDLLDIAGRTSFEAGYQYNVNIAVYGLQKVSVFVTLTQWGEGGSMEIDNDKEWADEPKLGLKTDRGYLYFYSDPIAVGTPVTKYDRTTSSMVPAEAGDYTFENPQIAGHYGVSIDSDSKVSAFITTPQQP